MTLIRYKNRPFTNFDQLWNQWLNDFPSVETSHNNAVPATNISETKDAYNLQFLVPGRKKEDFKIEIAEGILTVEAVHKSADEDSDEKVIRKEFELVAFKRSFHVDESIDASNIEAKYDQGVLSIKLPKKAHTATLAQQISVK